MNRMGTRFKRFETDNDIKTFIDYVNCDTEYCYLPQHKTEKRSLSFTSYREGKS